MEKKEVLNDGIEPFPMNAGKKYLVAEEYKGTKGGPDNWTVDNPTVDNWTVDNPTVKTIGQKWTIGQWTIRHLEGWHRTFNSHLRVPFLIYHSVILSNNGGEDRHRNSQMVRKSVNAEKDAVIRAIYRDRANQPFLAYLKGLLADCQNKMTRF
ncbi:hypothetical protein GPALN_010750 [Globodera pallida]|nr:hypothetical protein GPALN_010750 [Globodera pallida]